MKITDEVMQQQAALAIKNAPNDDWRGHGALTLTGVSQLIPVRKPHDWNKKEPIIGEATVAFFKFEKPKKEEGRFAFIGFTLAAMEVQGKMITETSPVISRIRDEDFCLPANRLSNRFCPECGKIDSVKSRSKRKGPECIFVTYYCKCGYEDHDVID